MTFREFKQMLRSREFWAGYFQGGILAVFIFLLLLIGFSASCRGAEASRPGGAQTADLGRRADSLISDRFLSALSAVESQNRSNATGDGGRARGAFQFHKGAWNDVSALRLLRGTNYYRYDQAVNYAVAREYARERCLWLQAQLTVAMDRLPTAAEIYGAYNCGLTGFERRHYKIKNCPRSTRDAVKKLEAML